MVGVIGRAFHDTNLKLKMEVIEQRQQNNRIMMKQN